MEEQNTGRRVAEAELLWRRGEMQRRERERVNWRGRGEVGDTRYLVRQGTDIGALSPTAVPVSAASDATSQSPFVNIT